MIRRLLTGDPADGRAPLAALAVAAGAVTVVWLVKVVLMPRPFWAFVAGDGEVDFFFNALLLAGGHRPATAFHPGTPVQLLGAGMAAVLGSRPAAIQRFLTAGYVVGLAGSLAAMALLTLTVLRGVPGLLATGVLLSYWASPSALTYLTQWGAYMFHLPVGILALVAILAVARSGATRPRVFAAGALVGFACAVQMLFVPLVVAGAAAVAVAVLATTSPDAGAPARAWERPVAGLLVAVTVAAVAFALRLPPRAAWPLDAATAAALALAVVTLVGWWRGAGAPRTRAGRVLAGLATFAAGALLGFLVCTFFMVDRIFARYARGTVYDERITNVHALDVVSAAGALLMRAPFWTAIAATTTILLGVAAWRSRARTERRADAVAAGCLLAALALGLALPLLYGGFGRAAAGVTFRYLLPAAVTGCVALAWLASRHARGPHRAARRLGHVAGAVLVVAFGAQAVRDVAEHRAAIATAASESRMIAHAAAEAGSALGRPAMILEYDVARPAWALRTGSAYADRRFDAALDRLFPLERELPLYDRGPDLARAPRDGRAADLLVLRDNAFERGRFRELRALGRVDVLDDGDVRGRLVVVRRFAP